MQAVNMGKVIIALGANIPWRESAPAQTLRAALGALAQSGVNVNRVSHIYRSPAWPNPADPEFVNAVALGETALPPRALMDVLHEIEASFGRKRGKMNAPRTLDIDLIDYDGRVEAGPPVLPHPRAETRGFVLIPLSEIAPAWRHPVSHKTAAELLAGLPQAIRDSVKR
jgi:2-amino-4-hydroxy-6-hydroxymethyldihydropteridine diphosphokinase